MKPSGPAVQVRTKDDAYDQFMHEMESLLWCTPLHQEQDTGNDRCYDACDTAFPSFPFPFCVHLRSGKKSKFGKSKITKKEFREYLSKILLRSILRVILHYFLLSIEKSLHSVMSACVYHWFLSLQLLLPSGGQTYN